MGGPRVHPPVVMENRSEAEAALIQPRGMEERDVGVAVKNRETAK